MPDSRLGGDKLLLAPSSSCCKAGQELLPPHSAGKVLDSGLSAKNSTVLPPPTCLAMSLSTICAGGCLGSSNQNKSTGCNVISDALTERQHQTALSANTIV